MSKITTEVQSIQTSYRCKFNASQYERVARNIVFVLVQYSFEPQYIYLRRVLKSHHQKLVIAYIASRSAAA